MRPVDITFLVVASIVGDEDKQQDTVNRAVHCAQSGACSSPVQDDPAMMPKCGISKSDPLYNGLPAETDY
ncbi:predicted protein [Sclerotinia sclerotiorum 1980 UF-70]|uniref:Uncharacterized protein n=1 Tax=Sclerotinia sclerotiorum (strain ATCC 18683 / 1980 / Ss-1) TaxID=665079 RepID=A7ETT9_SCLS1|nr:predicted protein [Sclerotinia sclerotiorum 1980 UF-70]EDN92881.1 predicted protein [Sclerotinia sclerotiorum 1980 UF-70]